MKPKTMAGKKVAVCCLLLIWLTFEIQLCSTALYDHERLEPCNYEQHLNYSRMGWKFYCPDSYGGILEFEYCFKCDGVEDCPGREDEIGCKVKSATAERLISESIGKKKVSVNLMPGIVLGLGSLVIFIIVVYMIKRRKAKKVHDIEDPSPSNSTVPSCLEGESVEMNVAMSEERTQPLTSAFDCRDDTSLLNGENLDNSGSDDSAYDNINSLQSSVPTTINNITVSIKARNAHAQIGNGNNLLSRIKAVLFSSKK